MQTFHFVIFIFLELLWFFQVIYLITQKVSYMIKTYFMCWHDAKWLSLLAFYTPELHFLDYGLLHRLRAFFLMSWPNWFLLESNFCMDASKHYHIKRKFFSPINCLFPMQRQVCYYHISSCITHLQIFINCGDYSCSNIQLPLFLFLIKCFLDCDDHYHYI